MSRRVASSMSTSTTPLSLSPSFPPRSLASFHCSMFYSTVSHAHSLSLCTRLQAAHSPESTRLQDILVSRRSHFGLYWLAATVGAKGGTGIKKLTRKEVLAADVVAAWSVAESE